MASDEIAITFSDIYFKYYIEEYPNINIQIHMKNQQHQIFFAEIKKCVKEWSQYQPEDLKIQRMTGITNQTYKISHPQSSFAIIYRKFGASNQNIFLDREIEAIVYKHISQIQLGPKIYGYGDGIRIQEFIQSQVLQTEQMLELGYLEKVAYTLKEFHKMKQPQVHKKSLFSQTFFNKDSTLIQKVQNKLAQPIFNEQEKEYIQIFKNWVSQGQVKFLQSITQQLEKENLVFSHNDLLTNNVLIRNKDKKAIFIDYEYSCFNYPIYDIANYFNETEFDYEEKEEPFFRVIEEWPGKPERKDRFIKCYILAESLPYEEYLKKVIGQEIALSEEQQKLFIRLKEQLKIGMMLSNVMWAWWGIIVSKNPEINFDYIQFCKKRYRDYMKIKQSL